MGKLKPHTWLLIAILCAVCLTILTFSYIVTDPVHILPGLFGDSEKNYFTYLYQCIYGRGFWFTGMNYPYGEHIVYTDGQPLLSLLFTSFHNTGVAAPTATLWLLIGFSFVLSVVFTYRILLHFRVPYPLSVIFSCLIAVFAPQVLRISGHYALAYTCVLPMLFYYTIRYHYTYLRRYCVYIFILALATAFLHPYFAAMMLVWVGSYVAGYFIFIRKGLRQKARHVWPILAGVLSVFIIIAVIMALTDPVTDRPADPEGVLSYTTHISSLVTSVFSPAWSYVIAHNMLSAVFPHINEIGEGYAYLGIAIILALIFSMVTGVIYIARRQRHRLVVSEQHFSPIWLFMACSTLLLSMGAPFIWHMEWLLDYLSFLRQFRTLGRFSWIFYCIISIYGVVVISSLFTRLTAQRRFVVAYAVLLLSVGVWVYEAGGYVRYTRGVAAAARHNSDYFFSRSSQGWASFLQQHGRTGTGFQAILALSFFHYGSEKLWVGEPGWRFVFASMAACQLRLPMVNVMMSRSSLSQTLKQVKIAAGPYAAKPMLADISSSKPFLLIRYDHDTLDPDQACLLQAADYIGHFSKSRVYAFYPQRQLVNDNRYADSIARILPFMHHADTCISAGGDYYIDHLDGGAAHEHLFGSGAMARIAGNDSIVAVIPVVPVTDSQLYEFSCWFLVGGKDHMSPYVFLEQTDSSGHIFASENIETKCSVDNEGLWFRCSGYFYLRSACRSLRVRVFNSPAGCYRAMDELLLRPAGATVIYRAGDGKVMVNNHLLHRQQPLKKIYTSQRMEIL